MNLTYEQEQQVRRWVLAGRSDEEIAVTLVVSVKQIRPIRLAIEAELRPR